MVKPRNQWADLFVAWLEDPHRLDEMDPIKNVEVDDNVLAKLDEDQPKGKQKNVGKLDEDRPKRKQKNLGKSA